jgi:hypothetical protein
VLRCQREIEGGQAVTVRDDVLHQPVEARRPADHPVTDPVTAVAARNHLADDFVDRKAVHFGGTGSGVAG